MRIKEISVKKLFGTFDHTIPLNMEDRVTVIIGPNGYGKTSLLKLINAVFSYDLETIIKIPFEEFRVDFEDSNDGVSHIVVRKIIDNFFKPIRFYRYVRNAETADIFPEDSIVSSNEGIEELFQWAAASNNEESSTKIIVEKLRKILAAKRKQLPDRLNMHTTIRIEDENDRKVRTSEFPIFFTSKTNLDLSENERLILSYNLNKPDWLLDFIDSKNIYFMDIQRLFKFYKEELSPEIEEGQKTRLKKELFRIVPAVDEFPTALSRVYGKKLSDFVEFSQKLDASFPSRIIRQKASEKLSEEDIRKKLEILQAKRRRLVSVGLLEKEEDVEIPTESIEDSKLEALSLYLSDVEEKLNSFNDIADKIEYMINTINRHFEYKNMSVIKDKGFVFTNSNNVVLSPSELSSGEQHLLIFLYELLFKVNPGTLILIDEPEISMHIAWQKEFISDLMEITKLSDLDFILATHSPDIIDDNWNLTVELKGE